MSLIQLYWVGIEVLCRNVQSGRFGNFLKAANSNQPTTFGDEPKFSASL